MSTIRTNLALQGPSFLATFWQSGVCLRALVFLGIFAVMQMQPIGVVMFATVIAADLSVYIWQLLRFSNVASYHLQQTGRFWSVFFCSTFYLIAAILMIMLWASLFSEADITGKRRNADRSATPKPARFAMQMSQDKRSLEVSGVMTAGMMLEVEKMMQTTPGVEALVLNSPGGNLYEARALARFVKNKEMTTFVQKECSASCLLAFMAGETRAMGPGAELGFHRYGLDFNQLLPFADAAEELPKDRQFFLSQGVSSSFIDKIFTPDRKALWYPNRQELLRAGVLTE